MQEIREREREIERGRFNKGINIFPQLTYLARYDSIHRGMKNNMLFQQGKVMMATIKAYIIREQKVKGFRKKVDQTSKYVVHSAQLYYILILYLIRTRGIIWRVWCRRRQHNSPSMELAICLQYSQHFMAVHVVAMHESDVHIDLTQFTLKRTYKFLNSLFSTIFLDKVIFK